MTMTDPADDRALFMEQEYVEAYPLDRVAEHPDNANRGDDEAVTESIEDNGFYGALVVQKSTGYAVVGNTRLRALRAKGADTSPVFLVDIDDRKALKLLAVDNRARDLALTDQPALAALLSRIVQGGEDAGEDDPLAGTLYTSGDLDALLAALNRSDADDGRTPQDRAEAHFASPIRSIILPLTIADYDEAIDGLATLRARWGAESNTAVVLRLVHDAVADA